MKPWQIVLTTISLVGVAVYLGLAFHWSAEQRDEQICEQFRIVVTDSTDHQYVTSKSLFALIKQADLNPKGKAYSEISTTEIEQAIQQHAFVRDAECYKTVDNQVIVKVTQRKPIMRVMGEKDYFVDSDREIMPVGTTTATYVPIFTGRVTQKRATTDLYDFAQFLHSDKYWNAQIVQIEVLPNQELLLVPRVGDHVIRLGKLENYEKKLNRLQTFYTEGMNAMGWKAYKELDLRYDGQVVGIHN